MSHFSKIKTNISNLEMLKKTLKDLGFHYNLSKQRNDENNHIIITVKSHITHKPLFNFNWNGEEFVLMADLYLWNLDVSIEYFLDKLFQQYAYNVVLNESLTNGFNNSIEKVTDNGCIKLVVEKWNNK